MNRPVRIGGHTLEAKRIAEAVQRAPDKFTPHQNKVAERILFWTQRNPSVLRGGTEIQDALEGMHDSAVENSLI